MKKEKKARNYLSFLAMNITMIIRLPQTLAIFGLTSTGISAYGSLLGNQSLGNSISAGLIIYALVIIIICLLISYFVLSRLNKFVIVVYGIWLVLLIAGYFQMKSSYFGAVTPFPVVDVVLTVLVIIAAIYGIKDNNINENIQTYIQENILKKNK